MQTTILANGPSLLPVLLSSTINFHPGLWKHFLKIANKTKRSDDVLATSRRRRSRAVADRNIKLEDGVWVKRGDAWDDVLMSDLAAQSESLGTSIRRDQARTARHDAPLHGASQSHYGLGLRGCSTSEVPQLLIYPPNTRIRIMGTSGSALSSSSDEILNCLVPNYRFLEVV